MSEAKEESENLRREAKKALCGLLNIPEGTSNGLAERFVDCVIGAAILEIAAIQKESAKHISVIENP